MVKLLLILIVGGALSEGLAPSQPPLLIDTAPSAAGALEPLDAAR